MELDSNPGNKVVCLSKFALFLTPFTVLDPFNAIYIEGIRLSVSTKKHGGITLEIALHL